MPRPAIQLYTLRSLDVPVPELIRRVGDTSLSGVEFAGLGDAAPRAVATALVDTGLEPVAAHVGLETFRTSLESTAATYRELGCETLVVPLVDAARFSSAQAIAVFADELDAIAESLGDLGLQVGYHNHAFEFERLTDGRLGFDRLVAETNDDVVIELDVGLAHWAGADPLALLERHRDRIDLVHLTDSVPGEEPHHRHYRTGSVDLDACAAAARDAGVEWGIYEHGQPDSPTEALREAATHLPHFLET